MQDILPKGFIESIQTAQGFDREYFVQAHLSPSPLSVRFNPDKVNKRNPLDEQVPWCEDACYLNERPDFTLDPIFHAGGYYVQEASSMSICSILNELNVPRNSLRVLDLCAAPGGKSTIISSWMGEDGILVANETIKSRANVLAHNLTKWGHSNVIVTNNDPKQFSSLTGYFDLVLVDAPCSGSGLFRKDKHALKEWSEEAVKHCSLRQKRIIQDIWPAIKPDGILIYATCSYSEEENEQIGEYILDQYDSHEIPIRSLEKLETGVVKSKPGYRFYPNRIKGEGFYVAVFQKGSINDKQIKQYYSQEKKPSKLNPALENWIEKNDQFITVETHLGINLVYKNFWTQTSFLLNRFHILKFGILAGRFLGKDFIPDHELALSLKLSQEIKTIELNKEYALRFLKKETLAPINGIQGWHVVKYEGLGIGWIKALPGRLNNYLPKNQRILKDLNSTYP